MPLDIGTTALRASLTWSDVYTLLTINAVLLPTLSTLSGRDLIKTADLFSK